MTELLLVRHAQASFGTDDYDRLSALGHRQSRWLGEWLAERGPAFDRVVTGTLRRHRETLAGLVEGGLALPAPIEHAGLDEYDADVLLHAWRARTGTPAPAAGSGRREHFRQLRDALEDWVEARGDVSPHRPFGRFLEGVRAGLAEARADRAARRVLVISSGGPISTLIAEALGAPHASMVRINLQLRNTGVTEFRCGEHATHCVAFNAVPHLDPADRRDGVTYS